MNEARMAYVLLDVPFVQFMWFHKHYDIAKEDSQIYLILESLAEQG